MLQSQSMQSILQQECHDTHKYMLRQCEHTMFCNHRFTQIQGKSVFCPFNMNIGHKSQSQNPFLLPLVSQILFCAHDPKHFNRNTFFVQVLHFKNVRKFCSMSANFAVHFDLCQMPSVTHVF